MNPLFPLVPRLWSAEEALAAITLLRTAINAVEQVHGKPMVEAIGQEPDRWDLDGLLDDPELESDLYLRHVVCRRALTCFRDLGSPRQDTDGAGPHPATRWRWCKSRCVHRRRRSSS